jgi:predicted nucleic-acid-binding protein
VDPGIGTGPVGFSLESPAHSASSVVKKNSQFGAQGRGFDRHAIVVSLAGLPAIHVEDASVVAQALDWFAAGMDFADALHLASSRAADGFATFDRKLATQARKLTDIEVTPLA